MPRIARMIVKGEPAVYHVMSRTALTGYVLGDVEKEYLFKLISQLSAVYFTEVIGYCLMGNHFHLLVRMLPGEDFSDNEIKKRFTLLYGNDGNRKMGAGQIPVLRKKWASLSEFVKDVKQCFSRYYNRLHNRKGFFWSERFKSVIVDNGETLINCLAYIDLNPVRAGLVKKPEDYRWSSLGFHAQTGNKDGLLSLDFGLKEFGLKTEKERFRVYRNYVHGKGAISDITHSQENEKGELTPRDVLKYRCRYFTDSGIIGSKTFVAHHYAHFKHLFYSRHEKRPKTIKGMDGIYSLKRLSEPLAY